MLEKLIIEKNTYIYINSVHLGLCLDFFKLCERCLEKHARAKILWNCINRCTGESKKKVSMDDELQNKCKIVFVWLNFKEAEAFCFHISPQQVRVPKSELCTVCRKRAYPMDALIVDKKKYHKSCFCCEHCKNKLRYMSCSSFFVPILFLLLWHFMGTS